MRKSHHAPNEKVRIIMDSINTHIIHVELCCMYNINPITFTRWRESFLKSDKSPLSVKTRDNAVETLTKENESLKKLIDEIDTFPREWVGHTFETKSVTYDVISTLTEALTSKKLDHPKFVLRTYNGSKYI